MTAVRANAAPDEAADPAAETRLFGYLAEFDDVDRLVAAAEKVRDAGFTYWECYTPFPVHGLDAAMGHKMTKLPWVVLGCGLAGLAGGTKLVWWTNATSMEGVPYALRGYDFLVSGKPTFSLPANIPPIFESTILLSAFGAFFGMLVMNLLPRFYYPTFRSERFKRATQDRFYIGIQADDDRFDRQRTRELLEAAGADAIEELEEQA